MDYRQAVARYRIDKTKKNLDLLTSELCLEMSLREKTNLLHGGYGSFLSRILDGFIFHGSIFYKPFLGGGCRRLGIPRYSFSDGPKGAVTGHGTCFPSNIMRAASFDPAMEYRIGTAIAQEATAAGANYFAGICINLVRNPRGGRSQESYGEDPFLLGQMGTMLVKSVQAQGVIACPKHFALNSIENLRFLESSNTDERTLREIYLHHFKKCIDAGALSIMGAYNKVNGTYCCENRHLLQEILREEWGFDGFTMSDFAWGVHDAENALKAGLDAEMPMPRYYNYQNIRKCIRKGGLTENDVDRAVKNILGVLLRLTPDLVPQSKAIMKSKKHLDLAKEAAVKGMVLLKNEKSLLPLPAGAKIAVLGPFADNVNVGDKGSNNVICKDGVTPYAGLRKKFKNIAVYSGTDPRKALDTAAAAETVILCVGNDSKDEGEFLINVGAKMTKKPLYAIGGDRTHLLLKTSHLELIDTMKKAGKNVVVLIYTGSAVLTQNFAAQSDAVIMGYYGGIGFGDALAELICGEGNFSGKLPVSIAKRENDYPPFLEIGQKPYDIEYGYYNGYYLFDRNDTEPAYPFGFGLSYTDFTISEAVAAKNDNGDLTVSVRLANTGKVSGAEVVQVYTGSARPASGADREHRPVKMLRGFRRVELDSGGSCIVSIEVLADDLKFYDPSNKKWTLDPAYNVYVGNSSATAACICIKAVRME